MSAYAASVEREYGLSIVGGRSTAGQPGLTRGETEKALREGTAEPARTRLARAVREAATNTRDEAEFVRRLAKAGLSVRPRYADDTRARVVGYAVGFGGTGARTVLYGGAGHSPRTSPSPSSASTGDDPAKSDRPPSAPGAARQTTPAGARHPVVPAPAWTRQALEALDAANTTLQGVPATDHAQWAAVAREAAGVYAAWSRRIEGDRPGPLARAADALAVSAQVPKGTPGPVRPTHRAFGGGHGGDPGPSRPRGPGHRLGAPPRPAEPDPGPPLPGPRGPGRAPPGEPPPGRRRRPGAAHKGRPPTPGTTRGRPQAPARSTLGPPPTTSSRSSARASRPPSSDRTANSTRATTVAPTGRSRPPPRGEFPTAVPHDAPPVRRVRPPGTVPSGPGVPRIPPRCRGPRPGHQSQTASCLPILLTLRPRGAGFRHTEPTLTHLQSCQSGEGRSPKYNAARRFAERPWR